MADLRALRDVDATGYKVSGSASGFLKASAGKYIAGTIALGDLPSGIVLDSQYTAKGVLLAGTGSGAKAALAVGANNTALVADSAQSTGMKWAGVVLDSDYTAKGILLAGTAAGTYAALAVGSNGQVLTADSAQASGLRWATPEDATAETDEPTLQAFRTKMGNRINAPVDIVLVGDSIFEGYYQSTTDDSVGMGWFRLTAQREMSLKEDQGGGGWVTPQHGAVGINDQFVRSAGVDTTDFGFGLGRKAVTLSCFTRACTTTSGSATVTCATAAAGDAGKMVIGTNIPPNTFVGTVTPGVSFTLVRNSAYGGGARTATGSGAVTLTLSEHITGAFVADRIKVGYTKKSGAGTVRVDVDEDTALSANAANATTVCGQFVDTGATDYDTHVLTVGCTGADVVVEGALICRGDGASGVRVWNGGKAGYKAQDFASNTTWATALAGIAPSLVVIELGINDQNGGRTPAQLQTDLETIVDAIRAQVTPDPSIALCVTWGQGTISEATWQPYADAVRLAAGVKDCLVIDLWSVLGTPQFDGAAWVSPFADHVHPDFNGGLMMADTLFRRIFGGDPSFDHGAPNHVWREPTTYQNSWTAWPFGAGFQVCRYRKHDNNVYLQGLISGGTNSAVAFTLPPGFRPATHRVFSCICSTATGNSFCRVDIQTNGDVVIYLPSGGTNTFVSLEIQFSVW